MRLIVRAVVTWFFQGISNTGEPLPVFANRSFSSPLNLPFQAWASIMWASLLVNFHHLFWSGRWEEKQRHAWRIIIVCVCSPAGLDLCTDIVLGRKRWEALFDPLNFFSLFKYVNPPPFPAHDLTVCVCVLCIDTALSLSIGIILWSVQMLQMLNNCWSGEWHSQFVGWVCTLLPVCVCLPGVCVCLCVHMHGSYIQVWLSGVQDSYSDWSSWEQWGYRTGSRLPHLLWPSLSRQVCIHSCGVLSYIGLLIPSANTKGQVWWVHTLMEVF